MCFDFSFRGKIFVHTVDRCYKLKLFLEQFGIPTCVLNSELPATSRCRAVSQFNSGTYDIIIASDEKVLQDIKYVEFFVIIFYCKIRYIFSIKCETIWQPHQLGYSVKKIVLTV
ncbi:ATP-dependent RNA helicase dbp9 [Trachymyrmex zeteki]|nr:ATP-dependent RNA helicase dbp9 [Trachymyrmex zeteki]